MKLKIIELQRSRKQYRLVRKLCQDYQKSIYLEENTFEKEQQSDLAGSVYLIRDSKQTVGTFRITPTGKQLALADRIRDIESLISMSESWEMQRFIIVPEFRGLQYTMNVYREIARYLREYSSVVSVVTVCNKRISKLVVRSGLKVLAEDIELDGVVSNYSLLYASVDDICEKLNLN